jgi:hypothetical protein
MSMYGTHAPQQEDQQKAWRDRDIGLRQTKLLIVVVTRDCLGKSLVKALKPNPKRPLMKSADTCSGEMCPLSTHRPSTSLQSTVAPSDRDMRHTCTHARAHAQAEAYVPAVGP